MDFIHTPFPRYLLESSIFIWGLLRWKGSGETLMGDGVVGSLGSGQREPSFWGMPALLPVSLYTPSPWCQMNCDISNIWNQKHKKWKLDGCDIAKSYRECKMRTNYWVDWNIKCNKGNRNEMFSEMVGKQNGKSLRTPDHHSHVLAFL